MKSSNENSTNDGRHYENPFDDYSAALNDETIDADKNDISEIFKNVLIAKAKVFIEDLEINKRDWYSRNDCSIYTGNAGIAQMFYRLGKILNEPCYTNRARLLVEKSLKSQRDDERVSYLAGIVGPLALAAILHYDAGDEAEYLKIVSKLLSFADQALVEKSNELLYGKIGYLYALLFVNSKIPSRPIEQQLIKKIIDRILKDGREYSKSQNSESPLMYQWHKKEYIGGAHGLAGILYVLLQSREYLTEAQLQQDVKPSLDYLEKLQYSSGNFPSSIGNNSDKLVHWCHGATSMTMLFALGHKVFAKESYLQTAIKCGEVVWSRGLLKKGYSLCHGVSGNAYTFICLYQLTEDTKYLYRACKFADWCMNYGKYCNKTPDRPFSLFEGLAGTIYFLVDLCQPKTAKFPGYTI